MAISTINPLGGGDFTSVQAWLDSLANTTLAEPQIAELVGETVENIAIPTITTSSAAYLEIRPAAGQKHTGKPGTGARIVNNATTLDDHTIRMTWRHIRLIDIEIHAVNTSNAIYPSGFVAGAEVVLSNIILYNPLKIGTDYVLNLSNSTLTSVSITNSLIVAGSRLLDIRNASSVTLDNNTLIGINDQILVLAKSGTTARNNYAGKASGSAVCWYSETPHVLGSNNASSDTTAVTRFGAGSIGSVLPSSAFVDPATNDYQLKAGSVLIDAGVTISGFTTDILGTTRPQGSGYDIGAFEYASGSPPDPTPPTGTVTIGTITPSTTSASVAYSYSAGDATGFQYRLNGGTATTLGASPATITGLTASTPYSIEIRATNADGESAWSTAANFTTEAAGDTTLPTLTGTVTFSSITQTSYTASWPAGSDNVGVTGYEYQIGGTAGAWTDAGNNLSAAITGRTAGATETVYVRAYDAAGLRSTPAISGEVTLLAATASVTSDEFKNNTGTLLASATIPKVWLIPFGTPDYTNLVTNGAGELVISEAGLSGDYLILTANADGTEVGVSKATAS